MEFAAEETTAHGAFAADEDASDWPHSTCEEARSPMLAFSLRIDTLQTLREYVTQTLCDCEQLEPNMFPLSERVLLRAGKACGVYFCVHGPRSVKVTAIWETDHNTILFYNSTGERFHKTLLVQSPCLSSYPNADWAASAA